MSPRFPKLVKNLSSGGYGLDNHYDIDCLSNAPLGYKIWQIMDICIILACISPKDLVDHLNIWTETQSTFLRLKKSIKNCSDLRCWAPCKNMMIIMLISKMQWNSEREKEKSEKMQRKSEKMQRKSEKPSGALATLANSSSSLSNPSQPVCIINVVMEYHQWRFTILF